MKPRRAHGPFGHFTRGGETWRHELRLFIATALWLGGAALLVSLLLATGLFFARTSEEIRYQWAKHYQARAFDFIGANAGVLDVEISGVEIRLPVLQVAAVTSAGAQLAGRRARQSLALASVVFGGAVLAGAIWFWFYGRDRMRDKYVRGAALVDAPDLARIVRARADASPYTIAGVPMRAGSEPLHVMMAGAPGSGKSQQFFALMEQVRAQGRRAIVYDPSGEFVQVFYRPGRDVVMNPVDARSPNWNIWNEIRKEYHFDNLANGLIPDPPQADPFWAQAGRMVLKDVYRVLGERGRQTNRALYEAVARSNLTELHTLLAGTAGASYVDPTTERTGMSLKMTVQNQLESFRFLRDDGPAFSIRDFVTTESDAWMFISTRESQKDALKPLLSLWMTIAIQAVLDLPPVHRERLWCFIDELPTLQKMDALQLALSNTRKYGNCMVIGLQNFAQLREIYGPNLAQTIVSLLQTKLLLRISDGASARILAELMGQAELDEKEETTSYGVSAQRDGVSVFARRQLRDLVLSSEILTLPDMQGFLQIPGDYPVARVAYGYVPRAGADHGFAERDGLDVVFGAAGGARSGAAAAGAPGVDVPAPGAGGGADAMVDLAQHLMAEPAPGAPPSAPPLPAVPPSPASAGPTPP